MTPVQIDVIAPLPEGWGLCLSCEMILSQTGLTNSPPERASEAFPPDWQEDFARLSELVRAISQKFGRRVLIRLYDPRSPQGMWRAVRSGARQYPTFLVQGQPKITGLDHEGLEKAIMTALHTAEPA